MWSLARGPFHTASVVQGASTLQPVPAVHSSGFRITLICVAISSTPSPVYEHWGCFHSGAVMNDAAVTFLSNLDGHMFAFLLGIYPTNGIAGSHGLNSIVNFSENYQTILQHGYTISHCHQQCM